MKVGNPVLKMMGVDINSLSTLHSVYLAVICYLYTLTFIIPYLSAGTKEHRHVEGMRYCHGVSGGASYTNSTVITLLSVYLAVICYLYTLTFVILYLSAGTKEYIQREYI